MNKRWLPLCLFICCFNLTFGQYNFGLDECICYAIGQNLQLKNKRLEYRMKQAEYTTAIGKLLPEIKSENSFGKRFGRSVDPTTNMYTMNHFLEGSFNLSAGIPLYEGFTRTNRLIFQRLLREICQFETRSQTDELAFSVMDAFFRLAYEKQLEQLAREQLALSQKYLRQTEVFLELGLKSESDLQEVKARLQADRYQLTYRLNCRKTALLELKQMLNLTGNDSLQIHYTDSIIPVSFSLISPSAIFEKALQLLPQAQAMDLKTKAARKSLAIQKGYLSPSLRGELELHSGYYDTERNNAGEKIKFTSQFKDNLRKYAGLTLSIPIFNGLENRINVRKEKYRYQQSQYEQEIYHQQLYAGIETACLSLEAALSEYTTARQQATAEATLLQQTERKWEEGLVSVFELMEIRNRSFAAQAEILRTRLQYIIKRKTVDYFQGIPLYNSPDYEQSFKL